MRHFIYFLAFSLVLGNALLAQKKADPITYLQSGPRVGYSEMREVMLWVQTNHTCQVYVEYWESGQPEGTPYLTNAV